MTPSSRCCEYCGRPASISKDCEGCGAPIARPLEDWRSVMLKSGIMSINDIRKREGVEPLRQSPRDLGVHRFEV